MLVALRWDLYAPYYASAILVVCSFVFRKGEQRLWYYALFLGSAGSLLVALIWYPNFLVLYLPLPIFIVYSYFDGRGEKRFDRDKLCELTVDSTKIISNIIAILAGVGMIVVLSLLPALVAPFRANCCRLLAITSIFCWRWEP